MASSSSNFATFFFYYYYYFVAFITEACIMMKNPLIKVGKESGGLVLNAADLETITDHGHPARPDGRLKEVQSHKKRGKRAVVEV